MVRGLTVGASIRPSASWSEQASLMSTKQLANAPACKSRNIRSHFDISIQPDGDYYSSCGVCAWTNNPAQAASEMLGRRG